VVARSYDPYIFHCEIMDKIDDFDDFDKSKYNRITALKRPQLNSFAYTLEKIMHLYRKFAGRVASYSRKMQSEDQTLEVNGKKITELNDFLNVLAHVYAQLKDNLTILNSSMGNKNVHEDEILDVNYLEKTIGDDRINLLDEDPEQDTGDKGNIFPNLNTVLPHLSGIENMVSSETVISKEFYDMYKKLTIGLGLEPVKPTIPKAAETASASNQEQSKENKKEDNNDPLRENTDNNSNYCC
jgi:uncharacterized protein YutE (UPF0331/DUF86 family)